MNTPWAPVHCKAHTHTHTDRLFSLQEAECAFTQRKPTQTCKTIMKPSKYKRSRGYFFYEQAIGRTTNLWITQKEITGTFVDKGCWFKTVLDHDVRCVDWWLERCVSICFHGFQRDVPLFHVDCPVWVCGADFSFVCSSITSQLGQTSHVPDVSHSLRFEKPLIGGTLTCFC